MIYIGIPAYGAVEPKFLQSLCTALLVCREAGIAVELDIVEGGSLIPKVRNEIANRFLATDFESLFFLDTDLEFQAADFVRIAQRPEDIVGGTYRAKTKDVRFLCEPVYPMEWRDGMFRVHSIATGFMCIKRHVLEAMAPRMPTYSETSFFNCGVRDGVYYGEDYAFCLDSDAEIWAYPCEIPHIGKHAFKGHLNEWLEWANDRTANHQPSASAHRETGVGSDPERGGNSRQSVGPEQHANPVGSIRTGDGLFTHCVSG